MKTIKFLLKRKDASEEYGYEGRIAFVPVTKVRQYTESMKSQGWSIRELREKKHVSAS